jgi:alkylation response protein AidB-like acyl-CoA dehydrogenase
MAVWDTPEIRAFRQEVRAFCETDCDPAVRARLRAGKHSTKEEVVAWQKTLQEKKGWFVGHWPVEHGGLGWSVLQRFIFDEEVQKAYTPRMLPFQPHYIGPILYTFGSEAQKAAYLPAIRNSETWWCQGYSEPNSGSDLYSLRTSAVREGDHYRVNGSKIWTTTAHWADMIFALVRTGRGQKPTDGISFLLIDLKAPGVTVRPIKLMNMHNHVNEVIFEDVLTPVANLIGEEGKAVEYSRFLLAHERINTVELGRYKRMIAELRALAGEVAEGGRPLALHPDFRTKLTEAEIGLRITEALCLKILSGAHSRDEVGSIGSILKLRGSELEQQIGQLQMDVLGRQGLPFDPRSVGGDGLPALGDDDHSGMIDEFLYKRAVTIYAGTTEVMKNILARTALRL